jgi:hypothetical protein
MIIKYFEDGELLETIEFADMDDANEQMYGFFREDGFESREEIVEFLNKTEHGDLFMIEVYPQSMNYEFV